MTSHFNHVCIHIYFTWVCLYMSSIYFYLHLSVCVPKNTLEQKIISEFANKIKSRDLG